jgi:hypothetical protein
MGKGFVMEFSELELFVAGGLVALSLRYIVFVTWPLLKRETPSLAQRLEPYQMVCESCLQRRAEWVVREDPSGAGWSLSVCGVCVASHYDEMRPGSAEVTMHKLAGG